MYKGRALPSATSELITTSSTPSSDGSSNIVSSKMISRMDLSQRAPVLLSMAFLAITFSASLDKINLTSSIPNKV